MLSGFLGNDGPQLVDVDGGGELSVPLEVEVPHAALAEVAGVTARVREQRLTIC